jgi:hydroxyethylthiazole kinase-like uncharacterized protein yjeF
MERILTADEMSRSDAYTIQTIGIPSLVLMERAALCVADEITDGNFDTSEVLVVCGSGNNGGDGAAIARILAERGISSKVYIAGNPEKRSEQLKVQIHALEYYGIETVSQIEPGKYTLIVDALFGIGLSREIKGGLAQLIDQINKEKAGKVAVDIASGIDADTGQILGCAVKADLTVTFARRKAGHCIYPGVLYSGETVVREIGIPVFEDSNSSRMYCVEASDMKSLPARDEYGNKATFGKLLVIAGSKNICGAAFFAACAALKSGIGMVKIFTEEPNRTALSVLLPEALIETYDGSGIDRAQLKSSLDWADGVVVGPGLGTGSISAELFKAFCEENTLPAVMDADALNLIAADGSLWEKIRFKSVITPHIGEMSRLTGMTPKDIKASPLKTASDLAEAHDTVCVLKDAVTVTAYPDGRKYINRSGCSALSTAGSGDVLAGILGGMLVRYKECDLPLEAIGVYLHGLLGETAAEHVTASAVTATELLSAIDCIGSFL